MFNEPEKDSTLNKVPIIIYSTSSQQKDITDTKQLGAFDYIIKQHDLKKLAEKLKNFLVRQDY